MRNVLIILGGVFLGLFFVSQAKAQCTVEAFPSDTITFTCGQELEIQLSAYGFSGNFAINNNFNNGTLGTGWAGTLSATFTNPCGPGPDGTTHLWMGAATPQPRTLTTQSFDLSTGANICYEMRYAIQSQPAPCEGPDEPHEGVYLQYSIDNGATWVTISYVDPVGGNDPIITSWQQYCHALPVSGQTANTRIRWHQDATSGAEYDHWGLDNVFISINDPNYGFLWDHSGFAGAEPPEALVSTDSVFTVIYTNSVDDTCSASVVFQTVPPVFTVSTVPDTAICPGQCIQLDAVAEILVRPASQPSFINNEFQPIAPAGQPTFIPVAVGNMPVNPLEAGTVQSVCLNVNNPSLPFPVNVATFTITLECPNGTSITLVGPGEVTGASLANMCFSDNGTPLSSATPPYTGVYQPSSGSLADFAGCASDGVWRMTITNSSFFGFGFFNAWNITFDVPEISYAGVVAWSPSTGLDNPNVLNPLICPDNSTTYELMVTDSFNCATISHFVTVDLRNGPVIDTVLVTESQPEMADGELTIVAAGGTLPLDFSVDGTVFVADNHFTGLPDGTYLLAVRDEEGCMDTLTFKLDASFVLIPNVISPTSTLTDNQTFVVKGMVGPEILVYNRWGRKVYESSSYQNDWNGDNLSDGVYFYAIKDKADGQAYTGFVQLVK